MAHPHPTPDVPGHWPRLHAEVAVCARSDDNSRALLEAIGPSPGVADHPIPGHVCATTWIFDPDFSYTLLVRHRVFGWSSPGGHLEPHEPSREGGLRELEEETGLTRFDVTALLDRPALIHTTDLPGDRPHRHWNIAWSYTATMDTPLSPIEGARWWPIASLPPGTPDLAVTCQVLRDVLRAL